MQSQNATTYAARLERYTKQRDEWIHNLQILLTPPVEQTMRKVWETAQLYVEIDPKKVDIDTAYARALALSRMWTDQEIRIEIGEKRTDDADVSLQMVVKSHATVLALATARRCRQVISVPSVVKFFRSVLELCAMELSQAEFFCTYDIDMRAKVRRWIDQIISSQATAIVPVGMFARAPSAAEDHPRIKALQRAIERVEAEYGGDIPMQQLVSDEPIEPKKEPVVVIPSFQQAEVEPEPMTKTPPPSRATTPEPEPVHVPIPEPKRLSEDEEEETLDITVPEAKKERTKSPRPKEEEEESEASFESDGDEPI